MQISRTFLTLCAAGLVATPAVPAREDTPTQSKAREALRRKLAELDSQPPNAAPYAPAAPVLAPVAPAAPVATHPVPPEQTEQMREAVRRKIQELNASGATTGESFFFLPPPASGGNLAPATVETMRESVRSKIADLNAAERPAPPAPLAAPPQPTPPPVEVKPAEPAMEQPAQPAAGVVVKAPSRSKKPAAAETTQFAPLPSPPPAVSPTKEARLAELLRKYRADEISPTQYHQERAKILAEP